MLVDLHEPADADAHTPAVIIVAGYPDDGFERIVGCKFKDMESNVAWAKRIAASGMTAVAYSSSDPIAGIHAALERVRDRSAVGLWASSGNAPLALSVVQKVQCAALCYPYTIDVPEAAKKYGFVTPEVSLDEMPPLFIARAGRDEMPGLNETLDRFIAAALARNAPLTLVNHANAPHAFDLVDDGATTRQVIEQILAFLWSAATQSPL